MPARIGREQAQGLLVLARRLTGKGAIAAVVLIDDQEVGHFHDAPLDALQFVSTSGQHQQQECVRQIPDGRFGLAHAHRLDNDAIKTRRFAEQNGLVGSTRNAPEVGGSRARPHKCSRLFRQRVHPGLVAQQAAPRSRTRGVDGEHGYTVPPVQKNLTKRFNEGALSHARHTGDSDAIGH